MTYYLVTYKENGKTMTSAVDYRDLRKFYAENDVTIISFAQQFRVGGTRYNQSINSKGQTMHISIDDIIRTRKAMDYLGVEWSSLSDVINYYIQHQTKQLSTGGIE